jgi:hypothetical protein
MDEIYIASKYGGPKGDHQMVLQVEKADIRAAF